MKIKKKCLGKNYFPDHTKRTLSFASTFFLYTFSSSLDIIKSPQNKNKKVETNMYKNYITGQTALTLNLDFTIPANHLANTISWFVDSIPEDVLLGKTAKTGRPAYHPAMMLKILLFAYSRRVFSGRKIELMLEENLPMMFLAN